MGNELSSVVKEPLIRRKAAPSPRRRGEGKSAQNRLNKNQLEKAECTLLYMSILKADFCLRCTKSMRSSTKTDHHA